jgi:multidrug resistance efflux pump
MRDLIQNPLTTGTMTVFNESMIQDTTLGCLSAEDSARLLRGELNSIAKSTANAMAWLGEIVGEYKHHLALLKAEVVTKREHEKAVAAWCDAKGSENGAAHAKQAETGKALDAARAAVDAAGILGGGK